MAHNSDSDSGEERLGQENPRRPRPAGLQNIWQLLVGQAHFEARGPPANSNAELVADLWRSGTIKSVTVKRAMLACPRHVFMPPDLQDEAYIDAPVRVHEHGFNVSAPHIHAAALEALELVDGDRFLDVGCGCGMPSAAAAQLVGPSGSVTSLDIRQAALDMSQRAVAHIRETDPDYAASSCTITWEKHNIFFPTARHIGKYSKVYIGAACPRDRLREILKLLRSEGGLLLVPVESELLLFKKLPNGKIGKRVMSAVRFSELEVPRDVDVVMACLSEERRAARTLAHPASTYKADMEAILNPTRNGSGSSGKTSSGDKRGASGNLISGLLCGWTSTASQDGAAAEPAGPDTPAASHAVHDQDWTMVENGLPKRHKSGLTRQPSYLTSELLSRLGPPDCYLHGSCGPLRPGERRSVSRPGSRPASPAPILTPDASAGGGGGHGGNVGAMEGVEAAMWRLPAHRAVLQARCEHLRALFTSGMRDAEEGALAAPEGVSVSAVRCLMHHVYEDTGVEALPLEQVSEVLHVAAYFGCSHLTSLCEQRLAAVLITPDADGSADDMAAQLLALADEVALPQLRQLALSYIVEHYEEVSRSDSYKELPRPLVDAVAGAACKETCKVMSILQELSGKARPGKDVDRDSDEDIL